MCVSGIQHTGHRTGPPQISGTGEHTPPLTHYSPPLYSPPHPPALLLSHTTPLTQYSPHTLLPSHTTPLLTRLHYSPPTLLPSSLHLLCFLIHPSLPPHSHSPPSPSSQCIAYIAAAELPANQWPDVIQRLLGNVTGVQSTEAVKEASLEAIGYICEEIVSEKCVFVCVCVVVSRRG